MPFEAELDRCYIGERAAVAGTPLTSVPRLFAVIAFSITANNTCENREERLLKQLVHVVSLPPVASRKVDLHSAHHLRVEENASMQIRSRDAHVLYRPGEGDPRGEQPWSGSILGAVASLGACFDAGAVVGGADGLAEMRAH